MKKQGMTIPLKSVIMTIGPSGCSKSTLIKKQLVPQLEKLVPGANIQVLSSDAYRREILGKEENDMSKIDDRMKYASNGAFKLMEAKFDAVTTWPVTADFVILDATFIGEKTRLQFAEKAKNAQYQLIGLIFNFDDREEYFRYIDDLGHKLLISQHLKRFRYMLGNIGRKYFDHIYTIRSKNHEIFIENDSSYDLMKLAKLDGFNSYFIVGDLHGCLKEFKELLISVGFKIEGNRIIGKDDMLIVSVGDTVDKGNETPDLIDFLYANMDRIKICIAGHDIYLTRCIEENNGNNNKDNHDNNKDNHDNNKDNHDNNKDNNERKYFDSITKLNPEMLSKFYAIMEKQCHFYVHNNFTVTHAPVENKYIGKFDKQSVKKQRSHRYPRRDDFDSDNEYKNELEKHFSFIFHEAKKYDPYHIFGHVALTDRVVIRNKVFLDTGCVYGNKLTGVIIDVNNPGRLYFKSVDSSYPKNGYIINHFDINNIRDKENIIKFDSLKFRDKIDVLEFAKNKVNFISGTMSPCASNINEEIGEKSLEDMREAFSYYKDNRVEKVMLQKKYMGSRANMYLFPNDIDKSYMVSRNGFVIRRLGLLDLKRVYENMLKFFVDHNDSIDIYNRRLDMIVIDGELMPWSALGRGLIESYFMTVGKGIESELKLLEETGFENNLEYVRKQYHDSGFKDLKRAHKKDELIKIIGESKYRQMYYFDTFRWIPIEKQKSAIDIYNRQIDLYGKLEEKLEFKPFAILKTVHTDGSEKLFWDHSNEFIFTAVSDDEYLVVSTDDKGLGIARRWFDKIVQENYEGVVIKPFEKVYISGVAPYIKVRNPNYLTIIYGYDYTIEPKSIRMIENKNIKGKLRVSIKEFDIGKRMLEIPYDKISEDNVEYLNLCAQMIFEEKKEKEFDPRL